MSLDITVVAGLGIISTIFAYYAFQLRNSEEEFVQKLALFLFFMSIVFLSLLMYGIYLMVDNDPSYSYLKTPIMNTGMLVMVWVNVTFGVIILFTVVGMLIMTAFEYMKGMFKGKRDDE